MADLELRQKGLLYFYTVRNINCACFLSKFSILVSYRFEGRGLYVHHPFVRRSVRPVRSSEPRSFRHSSLQ